MRKLIVLAAVAAAVAAEARTFEVAAWRGETVAERIPDYVELGRMPDGLNFRFGVLKTVRYAPVPESLQRLLRRDRGESAVRLADAGERVSVGRRLLALLLVLLALGMALTFC